MPSKGNKRLQKIKPSNILIDKSSNQKFNDKKNMIN